MPIHPIYVSLLPEDAQETIARVHTQTEPALAMLQGEGFAHLDLIDIFDGGPVVHCEHDQIRAVRDSREGVIADIVNDIEGGGQLISNQLEADFRCCIGGVRAVESTDNPVPIHVDRVTALALGVKVGDAVRFADLKPKGKG